jgi:hypothetical protein
MGDAHGDAPPRVRPGGARDRQAISSPLLDDVDMPSPEVLVNITGGPSMTAGERGDDARAEGGGRRVNIIFGAVVDENSEELRVTVIATGRQRKASMEAAARAELRRSEVRPAAPVASITPLRERRSEAAEPIAPAAPVPAAAPMPRASHVPAPAARSEAALPGSTLQAALEDAGAAIPAGATAPWLDLELEKSRSRQPSRAVPAEGAAEEALCLPNGSRPGAPTTRRAGLPAPADGRPPRPDRRASSLGAVVSWGLAHDESAPRGRARGTGHARRRL